MSKSLREYVEIVDRLLLQPQTIEESEDDDEVEIAESAPPGKKAEEWIKANKARFKKEYGAKKGTRILYGKAWEMFG